MIVDGALDELVEEWRGRVVPLRRTFGFELVVRADRESNTFAWVVAYDGDFAARDAEYYASPEREAMGPTPRAMSSPPRNGSYRTSASTAEKPPAYSRAASPMTAAGA
jgi:hypothetical protein